MTSAHRFIRIGGYAILPCHSVQVGWTSQSKSAFLKWTLSTCIDSDRQGG